MAAVRGHILPTDRADGLDLTAFQPERDRISAYMDAHRERELDTAAMNDFDERDLVGYFVGVGYAGVRLAYHCDYHPTEAEGRPLGRYSGIAPTPTSRGCRRCTRCAAGGQSRLAPT